MKSKEEMREVMAEAIANILAISPDHAQNAAEAALKALCGALPDVPLKVIGDGSVITFSADGLYNQLKQYGEK